MSNLENRRPEQPPTARGSTFHPGRIVSLSSRGEATQGTPLDIQPRGRSTEHAPSINRREHAQQHVERAGQPAHMQLLSQMAGETLRSSNSREDVTGPPPTPRLGFLERDFDDPIPTIEHELTATDRSHRHVTQSRDDVNETLSGIAEAEFNITKIFLESDSTSVTHEYFMEQMSQAHAQSDPFERQMIYNRLYNSIHTRIEHEPQPQPNEGVALPTQPNEGVALPPPKRKRRKDKDFTARASGSSVRVEDLDALSGF